MIKANLLDAEGEIVYGYFWYTDDIVYAMEESILRAQEEGIEYDSIELFLEDRAEPVVTYRAGEAESVFDVDLP